MRSGVPGSRPDDRRATRADDPDLHERSGGTRVLRRGFALTRWIALVLMVGFGAAIVVAIALAALFALVNASV